MNSLFSTTDLYELFDSPQVIRYFEDKLKARDVLIEKLKLKNSTLKSQEHKIEHQLAVKDDAGDSLHYIDFHQLQIENKQFLAKIEVRKPFPVDIIQCIKFRTLSI